ncbi:peptide deformylase 1 [cyanobacterium endosymbiont of Braarudosphaera bigelowii]|uniref:Peptide deformylase n=3 Tax=Candidatus Atelocyanobacterium thalassae TaxID=713887 RepID=A0A086CFT5_9CHRO|nr:MAG: peptide deformylase [Candidatus Atelocyanobacterium thalassa isolate SIO64986]BDA40107.1 peptide deformylase 1 [cyanobacterium endosymbiont of Braarudosphaera bigelowii]
MTIERQKLDHSLLNIHHLGDKDLRKSAKRISKIDDSIRQLARDMLQTMYNSNGIGLASTQIGIHKQLIVINCEPETSTNTPLILINPKINYYSQESCVMEEGCLSIPGVYLDVTRPEMIQVSFKDEYGKPCQIEASDLLARVIQHEIDHLNGVMFVDRVKNDLDLTTKLQEQGFNRESVKSLK